MAIPEPKPGLVLRYDYLWTHEAAAGQDHTLVAVMLGFQDHIVYPLTVFECIEAFYCRFAGFKATQATGNNHGFGFNFGTHIGFQQEVCVASFLQCFDTLTQGKGRVKWLDLFFEIVDQFLGQYRRITGNIVDRFFRVDLGKLPAYLRQIVNKVATHLQQSCFKHCKQTHGTSAYNSYICLYHFSNLAAKLSNRYYISTITI